MAKSKCLHVWQFDIGCNSKVLGLFPNLSEVASRVPYGHWSLSSGAFCARRQMDWSAKQQMDDRRQNQIEKFSNETFTCTTFCLSPNQSNFTPVKQLCNDCHKRNFWQTNLSICWDGPLYCMGMVDLYHLIANGNGLYFLCLILWSMDSKHVWHLNSQKTHQKFPLNIVSLLWLSEAVWLQRTNRKLKWF